MAIVCSLGGVERLTLWFVVLLNLSWWRDVPFRDRPSVRAGRWERLHAVDRNIFIVINITISPPSCPTGRSSRYDLFLTSISGRQTRELNQYFRYNPSHNIQNIYYFKLKDEFLVELSH